MTASAQEVEVPTFCLSLALTNRAARSIVQLLSPEAADLLLEEADLKEEAESLIQGLLAENHEFHFHMQNGGTGSAGDRVVNFWLATDGDDGSNLAVLTRMRNWPLVLMGTNSERSRYRTEFLVIDAAALPPWCIDGVENSLAARVTFDWGSSHRHGIPSDVLSRIQALPTRSLPRNRVSLLLADWERFLAITQRLAEAKCFSLDYVSYRLEPSGRTARFHVNVPVGFDVRKVHAALAEEVHIDKAGELAGLDRALAQARGESLDEETIQSWSLGKLGRLEGAWLTVELSDEAIKRIGSDQKALPKKGTLRYKAIGELSQVRRLRFGMQSLLSGRARNERLGSFLFDPNEAGLPDVASVKLSPAELLQPQLNEGQLRAVEGALNAPDLFLIQGPPGTGKTTVVAEICYQVAMRGGRTMVASQANLALDHAMSRLVHHPSIRALRRGSAERVEEEGKAYLEDYVIGTWLDKVALDCRANLEARTNRLSALERLAGLDVEIAAMREARSRYEGQIEQQKGEVRKAAQSRDAATASLSRWQKLRDEHRALAHFLEDLGQAFSSGVAAIEAVAVPDCASKACEDLLSNEVAVAALEALTRLQGALSAWGDDSAVALSAPTRQGAQAFVEYSRMSTEAKARAAGILALLPTLPPEIDELYERCRAWYALMDRERPLLARVTQLANAKAEASEMVAALEEQIRRREVADQDLAELSRDLPSVESALAEWLLRQATVDAPVEDAPLTFMPTARRAIWDAAVQTQRKRILDLRGTQAAALRLQKEADSLERIISRIDQVVGQLLLEVSPTVLAAVGKQPSGWRGTSLQNLWTEDPPGTLHPVREAESSMQSLLERILRQCLSSDPQVRLPESRIAVSIVSLRCLRDDLLTSRDRLAQEVQKQAYEPENARRSISATLIPMLRSSLESALRERAKQLSDLRADIVRAKYEQRLAQASEDSGESGLQALARQKASLWQEIEAALDGEDLPPLLPLGELRKAARRVLAEPEEAWAREWQCATDGLKRRILALAVADAATRPADMIRFWSRLSLGGASRAERQLPGLEAGVAKFGALLGHAKEALAELEGTYQMACQRWAAACDMVPDLERPGVEDMTSDAALWLFEARWRAWVTERQQIESYLNGHREFIHDWIARIESRDQRDEADLRQIYIDNANVIGITCVQAGSRAFSERYRDFDVVIIDEVSKATPPELLLPMLKGAKIVLVGDSRQLPPMVGPEALTDLAESLEVDPRDLGHLQRSLFRDLFERAPSPIKSWLTDQYRMHPQIMHAINQFYHDRLVCKIKDPDHSRAHGLELLVPESTHIAWISSRIDDQSHEIPVGTSRRNVAEVEAIANLIARMNEAWGQSRGERPPKEVGVITFYAAQEQALRSRLLPRQFEHLDLRLGTVDRFQGMEKAVIVVSLVCNNEQGDIGFAKEPERINVAFSRAQELLLIVGCRDLFCKRAWALRAREQYSRVSEVVRRSGGLLSVREFLAP